ARDWVNVLLESKFNKDIEITYLVQLDSSKTTKEKIEKADRIFLSDQNKDDFDKQNKHYNIKEEKVWNVGAKSYRKNNGLIYNQRNNPNYCQLRTKIDNTFLKNNIKQKLQWKNHYVDLLEMIIDDSKTVPVFT